MPKARKRTRKPIPKALPPKPGERVSHGDRRKRRQDMANRVKAGASIGDVAREFEVTTNTVSAACREFGVAQSK